MKRKKIQRSRFNIKKIIKKGIQSGMLQKIIQLSEIQTEKLNKEIEDFQKDLKYFGLGIFLWFEDKYPNVILIYSLIGFDLLNQMKVCPGMKLVVEQYYNFIEDVRTRNPILFKEEMEESKKKVFANTVQPKDLIKKDPFINYVNKRIYADLQVLGPQIQAYSDKITPEIKLIHKNINKELNHDPKMEKEISQKHLSLINQIKNIKLVKDKLKELTPILQKFNEKTKEIQNETLPDMNIIADNFKNIKEEIQKVYDENTSIAYQRLTLIKDIDSFHINFTKFIARLFHILTNKNRNYENKSFIQIKPRKYDPETRKKLKNLLEIELKSKYPELSKYLLSMFNYNKYRILDAHQNPKVRFQKGFIYFTVPGKQEIDMNLNEITKIINTYSCFIDALCLF